MPDLEDEPFSYREASGDVLYLLCRGKTVKTLRGREAIKLADRLARADPAQAQLLLAKATGQFRFGNERPRPK
ncbi:MAG: hypothetical protein ACFHX7_16635 [Pseudomonadota bacterium]